MTASRSRVRPDTPVERTRRVRAAEHSSAMEGAIVSDQWRADADDYAAGRITADEFDQRTIARYTR